MKAQLLKINIVGENSFNIRNDIQPVFHNKWHYHPEIEIIHIRKGKGTHIIGDSIDHFEENDIYIIGENLPHLWRYENENLETNSDSIVIHFLRDLWSNSLLNIPEMKAVNDFLSNANRGLRIRNINNNEYGHLMEEILNSSGLKRLLLFLNLLDLLTKESIAKDDNLASIGFSKVFDKHDANRMNKIYNYVFSNFQNKISIEEISAISNLSVHSFCRYFKTKTNKTFSNFLLDVRIGHARKLLLNTDMTIAQVCFECGFNNVSNFNRYFKSVSGITPSKFISNSFSSNK